MVGRVKVASAPFRLPANRWRACRNDQAKSAADFPAGFVFAKEVIEKCGIHLRICDLKHRMAALAKRCFKFWLGEPRKQDGAVDGRG